MYALAMAYRAQRAEAYNAQKAQRMHVLRVYYALCIAISPPIVVFVSVKISAIKRAQNARRGRGRAKAK